jgi:hypothetical protein
MKYMRDVTLGLGFEESVVLLALGSTGVAG